MHRYIIHVLCIQLKIKKTVDIIMKRNLKLIKPFEDFGI